MAIFRFCFASFHFEAKMMAIFRFRFASFCFEAKMMAVFASFCFVFASFHFRFTSDFYVSHRCETREKKAPFFHIKKRKKFCFRFASFRFEAKMTAHPSCYFVYFYGRCGSVHCTLITVLGVNYWDSGL
jgi:hypothetical protein